jgi:hypothetical protein
MSIVDHRGDYNLEPLSERERRLIQEATIADFLHALGPSSMPEPTDRQIEEAAFQTRVELLAARFDREGLT